MRLRAYKANPDGNCKYHLYNLEDHRVSIKPLCNGGFLGMSTDYLKTIKDNRDHYADVLLVDNFIPNLGHICKTCRDHFNYSLTKEKKQQYYLSEEKKKPPTPDIGFDILVKNHTFTPYMVVVSLNTKEQSDKFWKTLEGVCDDYTYKFIVEPLLALKKEKLG